MFKVFNSIPASKKKFISYMANYLQQRIDDSTATLVYPIDENITDFRKKKFEQN
jgi:hypothetical protein